MTKVRYVDFYPDEWLSGTIGLDPFDIGVYITACSLIYSRGGPIERNDLKGAVRCHGHAFAASLRRLVEKGKLILQGTQITCKRCANELQKAVKRVANAAQNGAKGGRPPRNPNGLDKPSGYNARAEPRTTNLEVRESGSSTESLEPREESSKTPPAQKIAPAPLPAARPPVGYAFSGNVIRLTQPDLDRWRRAYHAIPDLEASLQSLDDFYSDLEPEERTRWFIRCSRALETEHQKLTAGASAWPAQRGGRGMSPQATMLQAGYELAQEIEAGTHARFRPDGTYRDPYAAAEPLLVGG